MVLSGLAVLRSPGPHPGALSVSGVAEGQPGTWHARLYPKSLDSLASPLFAFKHTDAEVIMRPMEVSVPLCDTQKL